jgi:hypothetical protein
MTEFSFPFEDIDTTEAQFSQWARNIGQGVAGVPTGTDLQVTAGSALSVDIGEGQAMVRGHYYISTAIENLALDTAHPSLNRSDVVVLRLDPDADEIVLAVVTGTAGSGVPTLTQTDTGVYEFPLATVAVPANSGVPGTITDRREFMGTKLGSWTTAGRPTPTGSPLFGFNTTTSRVEVYNTNTSAWQDVTPGSLNEIGDVTITSAVAGQVLRWNGSAWVNGAAPGFTARALITSTPVGGTWSVPSLASPIVKVTVIGGGGGGGSTDSAAPGDGGTTTFNAGGAGTVSAAGGLGGRSGNATNAGRAGQAGFASSNGGGGGMQSGSSRDGTSGIGGAITVAYLNLAGISTVNVAIGGGGAGAIGSPNGGAGGRGEVIVEYVAG